MACRTEKPHLACNLTFAWRRPSSLTGSGSCDKEMDDTDEAKALAMLWTEPVESLRITAGPSRGRVEVERDGARTGETPTMRKEMVVVRGKEVKDTKRENLQVNMCTKSFQMSVYTDNGSRAIFSTLFSDNQYTLYSTSSHLAKYLKSDCIRHYLVACIHTFLKYLYQSSYVNIRTHPKSFHIRLLPPEQWMSRACPFKTEDSRKPSCQLEADTTGRLWSHRDTACKISSW